MIKLFKKKKWLLSFSFKKALILVFIVTGKNGYSQFTNRYPLLDGFRQQIYIEAFDLPIQNSDPIYYSKGSEGKSVYCKNGVIFFSDGVNNYSIPNNGFLDFQPNWNNDFGKIVFTRDNGTTTYLMLFDLKTKTLKELFRSGKMDIDPSFTKKGDHVLFSSSKEGSFDIYKINLNNNKLNKLTTNPNLELSPTEIYESKIAYVSKSQFGDDNIVVYDIKSNETKIIKSIKFAGICKLESAQSEYLIYSWPYNEHYGLNIISIDNPSFVFQIERNENSNFLYPRYCKLDSTIYYSEFTKNKTLIKKSKIFSNKSDLVSISKVSHDSNAEYTIEITNPTATTKGYRMTLSDEKGNYYFPERNSGIWSDPNIGNSYTYVEKKFKVRLPLNINLALTLSNNLEFTTFQFTTSHSQDSIIAVPFSQQWDKTFKGYNFYSGDNHFHYNIGGHRIVDTNAIETIMDAENLDFSSPLVANIGNRIVDDKYYETCKSEKQIFGQEVRSHFHGHTSITGGSGLFFPQFWGPYYELFSNYDLSNNDVWNFAKKTNQLFTYVHPCFNKTPFDSTNIKKNTYDYYQNSILNDDIGFELANIWSDEIGVEKIFLTLLNSQAKVFINAGTDAFPNFFRSPPIGSTRIYTYSRKFKYNYRDFLKDIKNGNSFVTNGPILLLSVQDSLPGMIIKHQDQLKFNAKVLSYENSYVFQIVSNDTILFEGRFRPTENREFISIEGTIQCPDSGWIIGRVMSMDTPQFYSDSYSYAFTSPFWVNHKHQTPLMNQNVSAKLLKTIIESNKEQLITNYSIVPIKQLADIVKVLQIIDNRK